MWGALFFPLLLLVATLGMEHLEVRLVGRPALAPLAADDRSEALPPENVPPEEPGRAPDRWREEIAATPVRLGG